MPTMEPLDTAKHRRRPYRLIHSLQLPDEQRHRRGTTLTCAALVGGHGTASPTSGCVYTRRLCTARMYGDTLVGHRELAREIMEKRGVTPHASQPRIVLATFKCNTITSDFPRRPQCLVLPTALSTGRRWNTPQDAAANWC